MKMFQSAHFATNKKYLIVGLGNPGKEYVNTRHNVGFEMVDAIASFYDTKIKKVKCKAIIGEGNINGNSVIFAKPQTYMNLSGESVRELSEYYKIPNENIIIIYDDFSLEVAKIRIRKKGSAGGHNGIKNIILQLNSDVFPRIKVGTGAPKDDVVNFVLGGFSKEDTKKMIDVAIKMPEIISTIITDGIDIAMNNFN